MVACSRCVWGPARALTSTWCWCQSGVETVFQLPFLWNARHRFRVSHVLPLPLFASVGREFVSWAHCGLRVDAFPCCGGDDGAVLPAPIAGGDAQSHSLNCATGHCAIRVGAFPGLIACIHDGVCMGSPQSLRTDELPRAVPVHRSILAMGSVLILRPAGAHVDHGCYRHGGWALVLLLGGRLPRAGRCTGVEAAETARHTVHSVRISMSLLLVEERASPV